ncbi:hypothetical protein [Winogradskyella sp.]|uniref:hypothetical protein n=1 Tax=Winogradskyella sp. TaxID=1883156 RepID=UPI0026039A73|nr:hypothetical protein [Winogradskyella sp.]
MKILKRGAIALLIVVFAINISNSQEESPTMFAVHTDNVKFEMIPKYEELSLKFKTLCEEHEIKDLNWTTISVEDGRYVYVMPIKNMAELDKNHMEEMEKKIGEDKINQMFTEFDECYDSYNTQIVHLKSELSYMPEGYSTKEKNHREYHFLYYPPKNAKAMKEAMGKVKEMFKAKGIKNGYEVYHSGFGSDGIYYMVAIAGASEMAIAQGGEENDKLLGEEKDAVFWEVIKLTSKYDQVEANIRPDLSYWPAVEEE